MNKEQTTKHSPQQAGGLAVAKKEPPYRCKYKGCEKTFTFGTSWHSYLGHLGLHGVANKYFKGDIKAAQEHLRKNGLARQDPAPWNGAWPSYVSLSSLNN